MLSGEVRSTLIHSTLDGETAGGTTSKPTTACNGASHLAVADPIRPLLPVMITVSFWELIAASPLRLKKAFVTRKNRSFRILRAVQSCSLFVNLGRNSRAA